MRKIVIIYTLAVLCIACKDESKKPLSNVEEDLIYSKENPSDSIASLQTEVIEQIKTKKQIKEELTSKGFQIFDYVDKKTLDTIIMQQYYIAFLRKGPITGQNEEETADLQKEHLSHLEKMYELGYADISGPFDDNGNIRGITIYNVPTLKMADSLANADPMVKAGRLQIEMHPWWAAKGFSLR